MFDQDMSADPDRIFGLLATMGIGALFLLILMFGAGCMASVSEAPSTKNSRLTQAVKALSRLSERST